MTTLSVSQESALFKISEWRRGSDQEFILTGSAGTGKTTIAKAAGEHGNVIYVSPTGKGADALRKRSDVDATTVHRALYKPTGGMNKKLGELVAELLASENRSPINADNVKRLRSEIAAMRAKMGGPKWTVPETAAVKSADLVVVDECFMLSAQIIEDLRKHSKRILYLGDKEQLPPVMGASPLMDIWPDYCLVDIHRQALENPILAAVTKFREYGEIETESTTNEHGSYEVISRAESSWEHYGAVEQIIVGRNATRRAFNKRYRERLGFEGSMRSGDRVMFLTNDHNVEVFNGSVGVLGNVDCTGANQFDVNVTMDDERFIAALQVWDGVTHGHAAREAPHEYLPVDYSYAVTCHKAQGSEYDSVLVYDERFGDAATQKAWMYTACTRAKKKLIVVLP